MNREDYNQWDRIERKIDILLEVAGVKIEEPKEEGEKQNESKYDKN